jgi:membrane-associated protein
MRPAPAQLSISALTPVTAGLLLVAALATAAVAAGLVPTPDLSGALEDASRTLGSWAYPAVAGLAFLETGAFVGLAVPGETAVVVGGVVASNGEVELVPLIALVGLAAAAGDLVSFLIGRRYGPALLERHGERLRLDEARIGRVEGFYARHGGSAVLLGRFVGIVRAVSPFVAGTSGLPLRRFVPWSLLGALLWATAFTLVGYGFSESFAESGDAAARIAVGIALVLALAYAAFTALRARSGGLGARRATAAAHDPQGDEAAERTHADAEQAAGEHVQREVDAQVDARDGDGERDGERERPQARAEDRDGGGRGEGRGAVAGRERRVVRERHERGESRLADRRPGSPERFLEQVRRSRGRACTGAAPSPTTRTPRRTRRSAMDARTTEQRR